MPICETLKTCENGWSAGVFRRKTKSNGATWYVGYVNQQRYQITSYNKRPQEEVKKPSSQYTTDNEGRIKPLNINGWDEFKPWFWYKTSASYETTRPAGGGGAAAVTHQWQRRIQIQVLIQDLPILLYHTNEPDQMISSKRHLLREKQCHRQAAGRPLVWRDLHRLNHLFYQIPRRIQRNWRVIKHENKSRVFIVSPRVLMMVGSMDGEKTGIWGCWGGEFPEDWCVLFCFRTEGA